MKSFVKNCLLTSIAPFINRPEEELSVLENDMVEDSTGVTEALDINKFYSVSDDN